MQSCIAIMVLTIRNVMTKEFLSNDNENYLGCVSNKSEKKDFNKIRKMDLPIIL